MPDSETFGVTSPGGDPILALPLFNTATGTQDAQIISFAGVADGSVHSTCNRQAMGFDPTIFACMYGSSCSWLEAFTGYRFLWLKDELKLQLGNSVESDVFYSLLVPNGLGDLDSDTDVDNDDFLLFLDRLGEAIRVSIALESTYDDPYEILGS